VTLGGVGEITFGKEKDTSWSRLEVGRRPTALALSADGKRAFVADTSADAVAFVDLPGHKVEATVALGTQPELTAEERGELLFYDARLSREGWFSCHSCHTDGHTNGGLSDTLSDGGFGAPKRVLTLLGVKDTGPWTWVGGSPDLAGQVRKSILTTMRGLRAKDEDVRDLTAYLRTLAPPPPARKADEAAVRRGKGAFDRHGCAKCHAPPTYTSPKTYDVGLHDEAGNLAFNPPSLRGVGQAGPYLHDGRAATLEEVFVRHGHPGPAPIPRGEVGDLVEFLRNL
jgi:cytochrome c peroxidase